MRITKLHLILLSIALLVIGIYVYQIQQERQRLREIAAIEVARQEERRRMEEERRRTEALARKKELAVQAVAVAGEYWLLGKKEGRDVSRGQATLHQAKENLGRDDFDGALDLARQAITELKEAPSVNVYYRVRRGDNLWKIARMPRHYGRGSMWTKIWRANEKKIPDFDIIYPRQVLFIPKAQRNHTKA